MFYDGDLEDGRIHGNGILYSPDGRVLYRGQFSNNKLHGEGNWYTPQLAGLPKDNRIISKYTGEFREGILEGNGLLFNGDGNLLFEGEFKNWGMSGQGKFYYLGGTYVGVFQNLSLVGEGKIYYGNQLIYQGQFAKYGLSIGGKGKKYDPGSGLLLYEGEFKNEKFDGFGTYYIPASSGRKYVGQFRDGYMHGKGKLYNREGKLLYEGEFVFGKPQDRSIPLNDFQEKTMRQNNEMVAKYSKQYGVEIKDRCYAFDGDYLILVTPCGLSRDGSQKEYEKEIMKQTIRIYDKTGTLTDEKTMSQILNQLKQNDSQIVSGFKMVSPGYSGDKLYTDSMVFFNISNPDRRFWQYFVKVDNKGEMVFEEKSPGIPTTEMRPDND